MGQKCEQKLIGDIQKGIHHQKLNVANSGVPKSIGNMVSFTFRDQ